MAWAKVAAIVQRARHSAPRAGIIASASAQLAIGPTIDAAPGRRWRHDDRDDWTALAAIGPSIAIVGRGHVISRNRRHQNKSCKRGGLWLLIGSVYL